MPKRKTYKRPPAEPHLYKYSDLVVKTEAYLFLQGYTLKQVSETLNIPISTVSWHLIHPLFRIDFEMWIQVRDILKHRAFDQERVNREKNWKLLYDEGIVKGI